MNHTVLSTALLLIINTDRTSFKISCTLILSYLFNFNALRGTAVSIKDCNFILLAKAFYTKAKLHNYKIKHVYRFYKCITDRLNTIKDRIPAVTVHVLVYRVSKYTAVFSSVGSKVSNKVQRLLLIGLGF